MKSEYKYLISFKDDEGHGSFTVTTESPLNSFNKIDRLKTKVQREYKVSNLIIFGITLISKKISKRKFIK